MLDFEGTGTGGEVVADPDHEGVGVCEGLVAPPHDGVGGVGVSVAGRAGVAHDGVCAVGGVPYPAFDEMEGAEGGDEGAP
ncbi:MAG: hypothetical protein KC586_12445 [Myxococcales bacterium]|nr:hypothetical protein [Myxococcales bacterium]